MRIFRGPLVVLSTGLMLASCSSLQGVKQETSYKNALKESFMQRESWKKREFATNTKELGSVRFNIEKLRSFEVISFPKVSGIESKDRDIISGLNKVKGMTKEQKLSFIDSLQIYSKPVTYQFRAVELQSCYRMIKNRPKHRPEKFFGKASQYKNLKNKKCLVLEVKKTPLVKKSRLKKDDVIAMRLYFDEDLRPYGKSVDFHDKSVDSKVRTADFRYDFTTSMSSELSEYPVDFPNFDSFTVVNNWKKVSKNALLIPDNKYVAKKISKLAKISKCGSGYQTEYKDIYGNKVRVGWCRGHSWPTTVHTNRFFSIVKRIK